MQPSPLPQAPPPPARREVINALLHAIAVRELAVASLLNAEAEKAAQMARTMARPESFDDVISFQRAVADLMQSMVRKEEVLLRRLGAVLALCEAEGRDCSDLLADLDEPREE